MIETPPFAPSQRHRELEGRGRADAEVHDLAADGEEAGGDRGLHHRAGGPRVAADEHAAAVEVGPERLGEAHDQLRGERLADDAPHAGDADLQRFHRAARILAPAPPASSRGSAAARFASRRWRRYSTTAGRIESSTIATITRLKFFFTKGRLPKK